MPVAAHWPTGIVCDLPDGRRSRRPQAAPSGLTFLPVAGAVQVELAADKPGYRRGETATFTLRAAAREPWRGDIRWAAHDFRGRVLAAGSQPVELAAEAKTLSFAWPMTDHGVRVDTVWVTAAAIRDGQEWARDRVQGVPARAVEHAERVPVVDVVRDGLPAALSRAASDAADGPRRLERARLSGPQRTPLRGRAVELADVQRRGRHQHLQPRDRERHG